MNIKMFHQSSHSAAGDLELLTLHLVPDLSDAVDFIVLFPNTFNLWAQIRVPFGKIGRQVRVSGDRDMRIKCGLGDWQNLANRLDTQISTVLFDEGDNRLKGRASSACAKYADAFLRISLAWRSSRISRSMALNWARSSEVWPSLRPLSMSDCLTQRRSVSLPQPIFGAMAMIAAD
jgi:hypothetical protein